MLVCVTAFLLTPRRARAISMPLVLWLVWAPRILNAAEPLGSPGSAPPMLTSAQQVLALGLEASRQLAIPVRFQGVVTYPDAAARVIYVQDSSAGIRVVY